MDSGIFTVFKTYAPLCAQSSPSCHLTMGSFFLHKNTPKLCTKYMWAGNFISCVTSLSLSLSLFFPAASVYSTILLRHQAPLLPPPPQMTTKPFSPPPPYPPRNTLHFLLPLTHYTLTPHTLTHHTLTPHTLIVTQPPSLSTKLRYKSHRSDT